MVYPLKARSFHGSTRRRWGALFLCAPVVLAALSLAAAQKAGHTGTKVEGFALGVTSDSITMLDKKKQQQLKILTDEDYTSRVGIGAPVSVWYKTEGNVKRLEEIVYPQGGAFVVPDLIRERVRRIIILPRTEGVENSLGLYDAISKYLSDNTHWTVTSYDGALEIARQSGLPSSVAAANNPAAGPADLPLTAEAQRALMMKIAADTRSDAVMEIQVVKVKAKVHSSVATWDDMTEPLASRAARALVPFGGLGGKSWVYAATVDMNLWNRSGKLLWKKRRGFAVLGVQSGMPGKFHERPLTEVYRDAGAMERWLEATLGGLAPPVHVNPAEPKLSPELRRQIEKANTGGAPVK